MIHSIHICASGRPGPGYVKMCRPGITTNQPKDQAIMSNMTYYKDALVSAYLRHITRISNKSNLPYLILPNRRPSMPKILVASTMVVYATIQGPVLLNRFSTAMPSLAQGLAGWLAAKNLSGFQKSAHRVCAYGRVCNHRQPCWSTGSDQIRYQYEWRKNLPSWFVCVKSAIFCTRQAMTNRP